MTFSWGGGGGRAKGQQMWRKFLEISVIVLLINTSRLLQWVEDRGSKGTEEGEKAAVEEGLDVFSWVSFLGRALLRLPVLLKLCNGQWRR